MNFHHGLVRSHVLRQLQLTGERRFHNGRMLASLLSNQFSSFCISKFPGRLVYMWSSRAYSSSSLINRHLFCYRSPHFSIFINNLKHSTPPLRRCSQVKPSLRNKSVLPIRRTELKRLLSLAKPEKWSLIGAVCLLIISSSVTMAVPFCLGKVIDMIYSADSGEMKNRLNQACLVLLGVFVVGGFCNFGRVYLMSVAGYRITQELRKKVFSSIMKQEVAFFDKNKTGELINRLSADTSVVSQSVTMNISDGLRSLIMVGSGISMMIFTSYQLALMGLIVVPPVAALAIVYGKFIRKLTKSVQDALATATQIAEERISNIRTVKTFSCEDREFETYSVMIKNVLDLAYRESFARGIFFGLTGLSGNIIILTVLFYGGTMVNDQDITVGNLSAFLLYAAYVGASLNGLSNFYSEMNRGLGASTRLWQLIDRKPAIPVSGGLIPNEALLGHIRFENVSFSYPTRENTFVIQDLDLDIPPASTTAVVGASGSGKSTLAALLLRLYDPVKGHVLIDGCPIETLNPQWLRKYMGTVSQEPVLFSTTIRENILYGASNPSQVTEEQLIAVAKETYSYDFISTFPHGFNTQVGERGVMLSGGQKQRVALARALIKNPRILILDEATSALDAESECLVQKALVRIMECRTVLIIAHRLSTILSADQIVVLDSGQVVEKGKYTELMALRNGHFKKLVKHQTFQENM